MLSLISLSNHFFLKDDVFDLGSLAEVGNLLRMIFQSMGQCSPTSETAEILITSVSKTLVDYNQRMKKIKKATAKNPVNFYSKRSSSNNIKEM